MRIANKLIRHLVVICLAGSALSLYAKTRHNHIVAFTSSEEEGGGGVRFKIELSSAKEGYSPDEGGGGNHGG